MDGFMSGSDHANPGNATRLLWDSSCAGDSP